MGYTHYWGDHPNGPSFSDNEWSSLQETARRIVRESVTAAIALQWESDQERAPQIDDEVIRFNGVGQNGHETFFLQKSGDWAFCKTARKPYDTPVVAILLAAQALGLKVSSDGSEDPEGVMTKTDDAMLDGALMLHAALNMRA